jgi:hypothetical protein
MAAGSIAARQARGKRQHQSLVVSHGRPVRSRGLHPLPTCQNEGYQRVFTPPNQTLIMVNAGLPKGILAAANGQPAPGSRLAAVVAARSPRNRRDVPRPVAPKNRENNPMHSRMPGSAKPPVCLRKRAVLSPSGVMGALRLRLKLRFGSLGLRLQFRLGADRRWAEPDAGGAAP